MKRMKCFARSAITFSVAFLASSLMTPVQAQTAKEGTAEVRAIEGSAKYSTGSGVWMPLSVGVTLKSGSLIETAPGSSVVLNLAQNGPLVRVTESTVLALDKMTYTQTGADLVIDTQLNLKAGRILGDVHKMAAASRYEVKTPNGVAGIRGTHYDISASGVVTVQEGQVIIAYVNPADGSVKAFVINAGETFVPPGNVTPADPILLNEVKTVIEKDIIGEIKPGPIPPVLIYVAPRTEPVTSPTNPE